MIRYTLPAFVGVLVLIAQRHPTGAAPVSKESAPDVKAIVSLAGILANGDCAKEASGKPAPVLIVHNDGDPLVKADMIQAFQDQLKKDGYESKLETVSGTTHWPAADGLTKAEDFIVAQLGGQQA